MLAYAITANGVCIHLIVPPLVQSCMYCVEREKQQLHSKKGGGLVFEGGPRLPYLKPEMTRHYQFQQAHPMVSQWLLMGRLYSCLSVVYLFL